jgi:ribosomal peptide maturation radical SAM protein 1
MKVLLVSMPFGALNRPALGLSLLKPALQATGIECDIRYLAFPYAELLGLEDYQWVGSALPYTAFAGDWTFTPHLYGARPDADARYMQTVLRETWQLDDRAIARLLHVRSLTAPFLDYCAAAVPWHEYDLVGFTSTFEQNIASLAMAKRIKARHPSIAIVFGGANWEGEMGLELHRQFPFVDYVCSGEADCTFPALARAIADARAPASPPREALDRIPGILYRSSGSSGSTSGSTSVSTGAPEMIRNMDDLPLPDFSDYFHAIATSALGVDVVPTLLFESSRGCWWGAKSHCTFCGLNGQSMTFRSKSPARALSEITWLADVWRTDLVEAVDNILDMKYFHELLPALARSERTLQLFYEVKANLTRAQVQLLRDAGVHRIQPGIESLSDHVLRLMRKGTTALRNIQLLKWCKEYGVHVDWNVLHGFPGETQDDYLGMLALLPAIRFLGAPSAWGPVRLDRFSPYHRSPEQFGMTNVRPIAAYAALYPFEAESVARIAYYFDYDYAPGSDPRGYAHDVTAYLDRWKREPESGTLCSAVRADGSLVLLDTRSDARMEEIMLTGLEQAAYEFCDELRSGKAVARHLGERFPESAIDPDRVRQFLDSLVANWLMVTDGEHYLSLAVRSAAHVTPAAALAASAA